MSTGALQQHHCNCAARTAPRNACSPLPPSAGSSPSPASAPCTQPSARHAAAKAGEAGSRRAAAAARQSKACCSALSASSISSTFPVRPPPASCSATAAAWPSVRSSASEVRCWSAAATTAASWGVPCSSSAAASAAQSAAQVQASLQAAAAAELVGQVPGLHCAASAAGTLPACLQRNSSVRAVQPAHASLLHFLAWCPQQRAEVE